MYNLSIFGPSPTNRKLLMFVYNKKVRINFNILEQSLLVVVANK